MCARLSAQMRVFRPNRREQPPALSIGSPALALQSCNRFTDAMQTYNVHTRDSIKNDSTFSVPSLSFNYINT